MSQPFFVAEKFSGKEGKFVKLEDTISSFEQILDGHGDYLPEEAFTYVGTFDEAKKKGEALLKSIEGKNNG